MESRVRPARPDDHAVPELLYVSAAPYYDAFAGSSRRARGLLRRLYPKDGHTASHERAHVAELDGRVVGVLVTFAAEEGDALARRFLSLAIPRLPPWRWPGIARHLRASATVTPAPPARSLYVDALAVAEDVRRRGVARALLAHAEELARARGLAGVALDTGLQNEAARALYVAVGFEPGTITRAATDEIARTVGGPGFISFYKEV
jgi:ribosomal protein S18 acetylase RimI-like enzyme